MSYALLMGERVIREARWWNSAWFTAALTFTGVVLGAAISIIGFTIQASNDRELAARQDLVSVAQRFDVDASRAFASYSELVDCLDSSIYYLVECKSRSERYDTDRVQAALTQAEVALYAQSFVYDATGSILELLPDIDLYELLQGTDERPVGNGEAFTLARAEFLRTTCNAVNPYRDGTCAALDPPRNPTATPAPLPSDTD